MNDRTGVAPRINNDILVQVLRGMASGLNYTQLVKFLTDQGVQVAPQELPAYFAEANLYFTRLSQYARDVETGKAIERLQNLYMNSLKIQDYKACLAVQKELNALMGLKDTTPDPTRPPRIEVIMPTRACKARRAKRKTK